MTELYFDATGEEYVLNLYNKAGQRTTTFWIKDKEAAISGLLYKTRNFDNVDFVEAFGCA